MGLQPRTWIRFYRLYGRHVALAALLALAMGGIGVRWAPPVHAGGWAVVTMDRWPAQFVVGEETGVAMTVRQHGIHPVTVQEGVTLLLYSPSGGDPLTVRAEPGAEPGSYTATLSFPESGEWQVEVQPGWFPPTVMNVQVVEEAADSGVASLPAGLRWWLILPVALAGGATARWARRGVLWQIGALLAVGGLTAGALWWSNGALQAAPANADVEYGKTLFSAKGCTGCHRHAEVEAAFSTEIGPNLTHYAGDPVWLESWLKNPPAIRPGTQMPNLGLSAEEINALSAFLLAEEASD